MNPESPGLFSPLSKSPGQLTSCSSAPEVSSRSRACSAVARTAPTFAKPHKRDGAIATRAGGCKLLGLLDVLLLVCP